MPAPPLAAADALERLGSGDAPPVVVFAGEEAFLAEEGVATLCGGVFPEGDPGGALVHLDAAAPSDQDRIAAALEELASPSLFGSGKVVVVRNAEAMGRAASASDPDDDAGDGEGEGDGALEPAAAPDDVPAARAPSAPAGKPAAAAKAPRRANPITALVQRAMAAAVPGSTLVLVTRKPARGKGSVSTDAITRTGALLVDCRRLYDSVPPWSRGVPAHDTEVARWVSRRARARHGKAMDARAAFALSVRVGGGLAPLAQALETLAAYVGARPSIAEADVAATVGTSREDPTWMLADAALEGDVAKALSLAASAFDRGVSDAKGRTVVRPEALFPMLVSTLHGAYRRLLLVAEANARGDDPSSLPALAGLPGFVVERILRQASRRSADDLLARHAAFVEAEAGVRGDGVPPRLALERLLVAIAR